MPARCILFPEWILARLPVLAVVLLAQPAQAAEIATGGAVVSSVLVLLVVMSIAVWTIVIGRYLYLKAVVRRNHEFRTIFWNTPDLAKIARHSQHSKETPFAVLFNAGYQALRVTHRLAPNARPAERIPQIERILESTIAAEVANLERFSGFLATTAAAAPFIGLFGTVWGIMKSFQAIGQMQSASLSVVAPGLSEALIATATGLIAAIPAVVFYNFTMRRIELIRIECEDFASQLLNIMSTMETLPEGAQD